MGPGPPPGNGARAPGRRAATAQERRTVAFGIQVVLGTLVNAILNDPGPLSLTSQEMETRLAGCLSLLLQAEINQPTPR